MSKKQKQLGMNPSTASHRLVKDILWKFIATSDMDRCFQCGGKMTRENFSIEHMEAWLDSEDPVSLYFDLNNISFSHHACNVGASRVSNAMDLSPEAVESRRLKAIETSKKWRAEASPEKMESIKRNLREDYKNRPYSSLSREEKDVKNKVARARYAKKKEASSS